MKINWTLVLVGVGGLVIGTAYGMGIPVVRDIAARLPKMGG